LKKSVLSLLTIIVDGVLMQTNTSWSENDIKFSQHNTSIVINYIHLATAQYRIQLYTMYNSIVSQQGTVRCRHERIQ